MVMFGKALRIGHLAAIVALLAVGAPAHAEVNPFQTLLGKWGGSGMMTMDDGRKERLRCDATYSGNSAQLRLAINCASDVRKIILQARLSSNAGNMMGMWEEKTFNALGTIAGKASDKDLDFTIAGNVMGRMTVRYTRSRQEIAITAQAIPLKTVTMSLTRR
jgi:hypothetical protein